MILKKEQKNQQGFTLVEVIVVAIIVAALAAVAIPLYNGYVTSSRNNMAANTAGSVASFIGACINISGTVEGKDIEVKKPIVGPKTLTCNDGKDETTNDASILVPDGINVSITDFSHTGGTVTGRGGDDKASGITDQVYHY